MSDKIYSSLYNIKLSDSILYKWVTYKTLTSLSQINLSNLTKWYKSVSTSISTHNKIELKLFYDEWEEKDLSQNIFLWKISNDIPSLTNKRSSFILFIYHKWDNYVDTEIDKKTGKKISITTKTDKHLYSISWWSWWSSINGYINNQFGYDIISRILSKEDKNKALIRYLENKNIIWNVDHQSRSFRKLYSISYDNSYWSIYTDMILSLNENYLEKIWITELSNMNKKNKVWVAVTSWLNIKKVISYEELENSIIKISNLYLKKPNFSFNKLKIIKTDDEKNSLKKYLLDTIIIELFKNKKQDFLSIWQINAEMYSDNLKLTYWKKEYKIVDKWYSFSECIFLSLLSVFNDLMNIKDLWDNEKIENFLRNLKIEWNNKSYWSIFRLLELEFIKNNINYFYFLWDFYLVWKDLKENIDDDFLNAYNNKNLFFDDSNSLLVKSWEKWDHEDDYNMKYENLDNFYVFDKVISDGVEFCDMLYVWNDNKDWSSPEIIIFHIKDWFSQSIRDLVYQVENSTKEIYDYLIWNDNINYFKKIYKSKIKKNYKDWFDLKFPTEESFLNYLKKYKPWDINVHLWIRYKPHWGDYSKCKSLVPKVAILDLQKKINNDFNLWEFKIIKIK